MLTQKQLQKQQYDKNRYQQIRIQKIAQAHEYYLKNKGVSRKASKKYNKKYRRRTHKYLGIIDICPKCKQKGYLLRILRTNIRTKHVTPQGSEIQHYHHKEGRKNIYTYCYFNKKETKEIIKNQ